jgi:hypothetical protein
LTPTRHGDHWERRPNPRSSQWALRIPGGAHRRLVGALAYLRASYLASQGVMTMCYFLSARFAHNDPLGRGQVSRCSAPDCSKTPCGTMGLPPCLCLQVLRRDVLQAVILHQLDSTSPGRRRGLGRECGVEAIMVPFLCRRRVPVQGWPPRAALSSRMGLLVNASARSKPKHVNGCFFSFFCVFFLR